MGRLALFGALTLVVGGALFLGFEVYVFEVLGQTECDRADCTWIGDLAYGSSANIVLGVCLIVPAAVIWSVARLVGRLRGPVHR